MEPGYRGRSASACRQPRRAGSPAHPHDYQRHARPRSSRPEPSTEGPLGGTTEGGVSTGVRVLIAASGPADRADLTWYARWRVGDTGSWSEREYPDADPDPGVTMTTEFVPLVTNLTVEVAYETGAGILSAWSEPTAVDTTAAP